MHWQPNAIVGQADMSAKERLQTRISDLTLLSRQIEEQRLALTQQHSELKTLTGVITENKAGNRQKKLKSPTSRLIWNSWIPAVTE